MRRYVVVPRGWLEPSLAAEGINRREDQLTVFELESNARKTGLFDARGNDLYAVADKQPIGFVIGRE